MRKFLLVAAFFGLLIGPISISSSSSQADSGALFGSTAESAAAVIAAGRGFHCWVHNGAAKCIGQNDVGQLGDGTTTSPRTSAVTVTGLSTGVVSIAAGDAHACALLTSGAVRCWGSNTRGQLGDGSTTNSSSPVQVTGLISGAIRIDAGLETTCAITSAGRALCWGNNQTFGTGSLTTDANADGEFDPVLTPTQVTGLSSGVVAISVSGERTSSTASVTHGCAVLQYGDLMCWGSNSSGQVGVAGAGPFSAPQQVATGVQMAAVANGAIHTCALTTTGAVMCWGANANGQLANGTSTGVASGTLVSVVGASSGIVQVSSGRYTTCAITSAGGLLCWGDNIHGGIAATPFRSTITSPTTPYSLTSGIASVSLSEYATCALFSNGDLKCWGANASGQTGDGYQVRTITPTAVHSAVGNSAPLTGIQSLGASFWTHCGVTASGGVTCWGYNFNGELGDGLQTSVPQPVPHATLTSGVQRVEGRNKTWCALLTNTEVKCWGQNTNGQFGAGDTVGSLTTRSMLTAAPSTVVTGVTDISLAQFHTCVVANGAAMCTGRNLSGALGDGTTTASNVLVQVSGLTSNVIKIAAGEYSTACAVLSDGTARCWGSGQFGQLGRGSISGSTTPVTVTGVSGATDIVAGDGFACVLKSDGTVACWGGNFYGELGDGTKTQRTTAVPVTGVTGATKIFAGPRSVCVIVANGELRCWGWNLHGVFADGTTTDSSTAVAAIGISGLTDLAMGATSSCGLLASGAVRCWGLEQLGQLGNNRMDNKPYQSHNVLASGLTFASQLPALQVLAPTTTTSTTTPTTSTTVAPAVTTSPPMTVSSSVPSSSAVSPAGTTRIDERIYTSAPATVGDSVMLNLVSAASLKTLRLQSSTPKTCIAAGRSVVTTAPGDCIVLIRSLASREVLRRWKTTVVLADNGIGSTIRVAPNVIFGRTSPIAIRNSVAAVVKQVEGARAALVVGHTAILTGNTQENRVLSVKRAQNIASALRRVVTVNHVGLGGDVPLSTRLSESEQAQNRRVVVYYVP